MRQMLAPTKTRILGDLRQWKRDIQSTSILVNDMYQLIINFNNKFERILRTGQKLRKLKVGKKALRLLRLSSDAEINFEAIYTHAMIMKMMIKIANRSIRECFSNL